MDIINNVYLSKTLNKFNFYIKQKDLSKKKKKKNKKKKKKKKQKQKI